MNEIFIDSFVENFTKCTKKPEKYLSAPMNFAEKLTELVKSTYDFTKHEENSANFEALSELIVENFDTEQIWQQLELQNFNVLENSIHSVSKLVAGKDRLWFSPNENEESDENSNSDSEKNSARDINSDDEKNSSDEDSAENLNFDSNDDDDDDENSAELKKVKNPGKKSIVDDEFFKLDEMEKFLETEEKNLEKPQKIKSDDEESVDLFDKHPTDEEDDSEDISEINPSYSEFFGDFDRSKKSRENFEPPKNNVDEMNNDVNTKLDIKSNMELREERLRTKIDEIENSALEEKPWQLKGEISAANRPQNSLLEEVLEFDLTTKPAPVVTEETTYRLEDIIKQRIKDKTWNDVERKTKFVDTPLEYKKKLTLDQEKSKKSLAQIYEEEFLKQTETQNLGEKPEEEEPKLHLEIKTLMKNLFSKLDSLSNFHFTPKSAVPELRIVSNLPAISMEEVAPVAASDAALLAPEEVKRRERGDLIGREERSGTDKKRERRQKKKRQREHSRKKIVEKIKPGLGNKYSKEKFAKALEKISKERNVEKIDESLNASNVKSSTAFFTQLQEEVQGQIKSKTKTELKKKNGQNFTAKKLKL